MSDEAPSPAMSGCLAAVLALIGTIMLLPGACAVISLSMLVTEPDRALKNPDMFLLTLLLLAIGVGGAVLLTFVRKHWGRRPQG